MQLDCNKAGTVISESENAIIQLDDEEPQISCIYVACAENT
jgi:hypothetical protein